MKLKARTRSRVATRRVQEVVCLAENSIPSFLHSKAKAERIARAWTINISVRASLNGRWSYAVQINSRVAFVGLFGGVGVGRHAKLECELRGVLRAFDWLKHEPQTPCEIHLTSSAFDIFMGEAPCPRGLKSLLDKVRRAYVESADSITIDRQRQALVSKQERLVA